MQAYLAWLWPRRGALALARIEAAMLVWERKGIEEGLEFWAEFWVEFWAELDFELDLEVELGGGSRLAPSSQPIIH